MWQHFLKLDDPSPVLNDATSVTNKDGQPSKTLVTANEFAASYNEASPRVQYSKRRATSTLADEPAPKRTQRPMPGVFSEEDDAGNDASSDADNDWMIAGQDSNCASETGRPWATAKDRDVIKRMAPLPWRGCLVLFGRVSVFEKATVVEERRAILEAVEARERDHQTRVFDSWHCLDVVKQFTRWKTLAVNYVLRAPASLSQITLWKNVHDGRADRLYAISVSG